MKRKSRKLASLLIILVTSSAFAATAVAETDVDSDGIYDAADPEDAELGLQKLVLKSRGKKTRLKLKGWLNAGVLGYAATPDLSDGAVLTVTGSEGADFSVSVPTSNCSVRSGKSLRCKSAAGRITLVRMPRIGPSASRYRVIARLRQDVAESLPGQPLNVTLSTGDIHWAGTIAAHQCQDTPKKIRCRAPRGIDRVPMLMQPVVVIDPPNMEAYSVELKLGTTRVGSHPDSGLVLSHPGVPGHLLDFVVAEDAISMLVPAGLDSSEAAPLPAGSVISLSGETGLTVAHQPTVTDAPNLGSLEALGGSHVTSGIGNVSKIIAFGDSITAGYTWFPDGDMMEDNYIRLYECIAGNWPTSRCSSNQPGAATWEAIESAPGSQGMIGAGDDGGRADELDPTRTEVFRNNTDNPWIAFPYQLEAMLRAWKDETPLFNYAVSGANASHWDHTCIGKNWVYRGATNDCSREDCTQYQLVGGSCTWDSSQKRSASGGYLARGCDTAGINHLGAEMNPENLVSDYPPCNIESGTRYGEPRWNISMESENSDVLFFGTLGANPILMRWMNTDFGQTGSACLVAPALCEIPNKAGASVSYTSSMAKAVARVKSDFVLYNQKSHLVSTYQDLLQRGNVAVIKYYHACPGFFGADGELGTVPSNSGACHDQDIAFHLVDMLNQLIHDAVIEARGTSNSLAPAPSGYYIREICPGDLGMKADGSCPGYFDDHQAFSGDPGESDLNSGAWITWNDTGIHPNPTGHAELARGTLRGICRKMGKWCPARAWASETAKGTYWSTSNSCMNSECAYLSVFNNTEQPMTLLQSLDDDGTNSGRKAGDGKFVMFPRKRVWPGETLMVSATNPEDYDAGPTIQLQYDVGGGPVTFTVDSDFGGGGSISNNDGSPLYEVIRISSSSDHHDNIVGNFTFRDATNTKEPWDIDTGSESSTNKNNCYARLTSSSKYASYLAIYNTTPHTLHLKTFDHPDGRYCQDPSKVIPPNHTGVAIIGDSGDGVYGTKGTVTYDIGTTGDTVSVFMKSNPDKQGYFSTTVDGDGYDHNYLPNTREAMLCSAGCELEHIVDACSNCEDTDDTVVNVQLTEKGADAQAYGDSCGGPYPNSATTGAVLSCAGNGVACTLPGYKDDPDAPCPAGTTDGDQYMKYLKINCSCGCTGGRVFVGDSCVFPQCEAPCTSYGGGVEFELGDNRPVCYRNRLGSVGQCWWPLRDEQGEYSCYQGEVPHDTLCAGWKL